MSKGDIITILLMCCIVVASFTYKSYEVDKVITAVDNLTNTIESLKQEK